MHFRTMDQGASVEGRIAMLALVFAGMIHFIARPQSAGTRDDTIAGLTVTLRGTKVTALSYYKVLASRSWMNTTMSA